MESFRHEISLDGKSFTHGKFHGLFGPFLVVTGECTGRYAEADIFDVRDGSHLRHVKLDLYRPLHLPPPRS